MQMKAYKTLKTLKLDELRAYANTLGYSLKATNKKAALKEITKIHSDLNSKEAVTPEIPENGKTSFANTQEVTESLDLNKRSYNAEEVKEIDKLFREKTGRYYGIVNARTVQLMLEELRNG